MVVKKEKDLYERVRIQLTQMGYYTGGDIVYIGGRNADQERYYINTGRKELQADVVGVRFSGNRYFSDIEVCAVEVKLDDRIRRQHINQAVGYKSFAHTVFLASTASLDSDSRRVLCSVGVGYIHITPGKRPETKLLENSAAHIPIEKEMLRFLEQLWIGRCTLCQCYFPLEEVWPEKENTKTYRTVPRPIIPNITGRKPHIHYGSRISKKQPSITRYLCWHCLEDLKRWATEPR